MKCVQSGATTGDILIAGQGDRTGSGNGTDRGDLFSAMTAAGYDVVSSAALPSNLSGFEQVWYLDTEAMTQTEQDRATAFVEAGGGLYLTGEWGCCPVDASTIALINRLVPSQTVAHGGQTSVDLLTITSDAPYGLGTTPHPVDSLKVASSGSLAGVASGHAFAQVSPDQVVAAAWDQSAVTGNGEVAVVMDINWLAEQYRGANWGS